MPCNIDRLNLGPVPTIQLNWLQPHEGNIVDFPVPRACVPDGVVSACVDHEDPVIHGRRRVDVLRQLSARQRAGGGAAGERPRRSADARVHANADRRTKRQRRRRCSLAASACISNSTRPSSATRRSFWINCGIRTGRCGWRRNGKSSVDPKSLGELTVSMLRGEQGFQKKEIGKLLDWLQRRTAVRRRQSSVCVVARACRAVEARAEGADLLHAAGGRSVPGRTRRTVSIAVARSDSCRCRARRCLSAREPRTTLTTCRGILACRHRRCVLRRSVSTSTATRLDTEIAPVHLPWGFSRGSRRRKVCTCSATRINDFERRVKVLKRDSSSLDISRRNMSRISTNSRVR